MFRARTIVSCAALAAVAACDDLKSYEGEFRGDIVAGNFVRSCFGADTRATLEFDPNHAVGPVDEREPERLNRLTTSDGTFDRTPLLPLAPLAHDTLSELTFPGPRRLRNYILIARPETGPLEGRDATVIVSLLEDSRIEVRVLARGEATLEPCADAESEDRDPPREPEVHDYFGVFRLR